MHNCDMQSTFMATILGTFSIVFWLQVTQIKSEICMNGDFCPPPKSCCQSNECCSWRDGNDAQTVNYPYGGYYKLKIWDMWYFWILIILLILLCFGGCGYWWRRQILIYTRSSPFYESSNQHSYRYSHRPQWSRTSNSTETSTGDEESNEGFLYSANNSPYRSSPSSFYGAHYYPQRSLLQPPPLYSEVTAKPDLYPVIEESIRDFNKTIPSIDNNFIISRYVPTGVVCATSPSSSTYSTNQSSVFLPPPYTESDVSAPYTSSYPASNISTPGSVISYSTNSDVMFMNNHIHQDSQPNSNILIRPCLSSPPLATSPTSEQMPSRLTFSPLMNRSNCDQNITESLSPGDNTSPTTSLSIALSRLEQNVSAIIRHSERFDNSKVISSIVEPTLNLSSNSMATEDDPLTYSEKDLVPQPSASAATNRRNSLGSTMANGEYVPSDHTVTRSRSLRYGRRGILIRTRSDDREEVRVTSNDRTILIKSTD